MNGEIGLNVRSESPRELPELPTVRHVGRRVMLPILPELAIADELPELPALCDCGKRWVLPILPDIGIDGEGAGAGVAGVAGRGREDGAAMAEMAEM